MEVLPSIAQFRHNPASSALLDALTQNEDVLGLQDSHLYRSFPLYRDDEGGLILPDCILLSPHHGVISFAVTADSNNLTKESYDRCHEIVEQVPSYIQSRLIKNRALRSGPTTLAFDIMPVIYAPFLQQGHQTNAPLLRTHNDLRIFFGQHIKDMPSDRFNELIATIEGAKGLIRPRKRGNRSLGCE